MDAFEGEHYPIEVDVVVGEIIGGRAVETGCERQLRCGCNVALDNDWGVAPHCS